MQTNTNTKQTNSTTTKTTKNTSNNLVVKPLINKTNKNQTNPNSKQISKQIPKV